MDSDLKKVLRLPAVWIAALGYYVDLYDLVLFGVVRIPSLRAIGVPESELLAAGTFLLNFQMAGMLVGGFLWGILGDRRGRLSVLYASIFLYSAANLANSWVGDLTTYAVLRFLAGVGLAGELGVAITLVSELLPKHVRAYGSTIIGMAGFLGAITACLVGVQVSWQSAYLIGGVLGLGLLACRFRVRESLIYLQTRSEHTRWGDLRLLFGSSRRSLLYLKCILVGTPIWFVSGILIYFAPEFGKSFGLASAVTAGYAILWNYAGGVIGDIGGGILSQKLRSRKKAIAVFIGLLVIFVGSYFAALEGRSAETFYLLCFLLGIGNGYWTLYVTAAAEQFGTNIRATVASSVPNLVRAAVIPMSFGFRLGTESLGLQGSALLVGAICLGLSLYALNGLSETFDQELDYLET